MYNSPTMFKWCKKVDNVIEPLPKPVSPASSVQGCANENVSEDMKPFNKVAKILVDTKMISQEDATTQLTAIEKFQKGKLSYAEMRAIAG